MEYQKEAEKERIKIYGECKMKAIRKILMMYNYDELINKGNEIGMYIPKAGKESFENWITERRKNTKQRWKYIMFTINFKDEIAYEAIKNKTEKAIKKKWIKDCIYQYECRNFDEEEGWGGVHVHIWCEIEDNKYSYNCKREMYNTFKDIVGNGQHVNCRYSNDENAFKDYVKGIKEGKEKENYKMDRELNEYMENL